MSRATQDFAEYDGFSPGVLLMDFSGNCIAKMPLATWPAMQRWYAFDDPPPVQFVDESGQTVMIRHASVATIIRRDLDAVVAIEDREARAAWSDS